MATASPSRVATFMANIDMLVARPMRYMAPKVTLTARPPVMTGKAAATKLPKTRISATRATGRP
jgi:hypothetical protein